MDATAPLYVPLPPIEAVRVVRSRKLAAGTVSLPEIDVSVVTYKSERWLPGFFASLAAQAYPPCKIHLYCIDHSPDGSCVPLLQELAAGIGFASVLVEARPNRGFGAGHNRTLALGSSDFLLVTNVDLVLAPDALETLVRRALDDAVAAGWEARQKPYEHPKAYDILTHATGWASSACILWRRTALAAVGGYDERFFMYGEDVDLSGRLRAAGWQLRYVPEAVAWHETYETAGVVKDAQYFGGTQANFWLRVRFGSVGDILWGMVLQLSLLLRRRFYGRGVGYALGQYWQLLKNASHFGKRRVSSPLPAGEVRSLSPQDLGAVGEGLAEGRPDASRGIFPTSASPLPQPSPAGRGGKLFTFHKWDYTPHRAGAFVSASRAAHEKPLVSFIVRTYPGRAPLLEQALASLAAQTWPRLEVIVVEDGGDTARLTIENFSGRLNLVYYPAPKAGRCQSGNLGLALATGDLIGFLDDDDLLFADHVETLAEALADQPDHPAVHAYAWEVATEFTPGAWLPLTESPPQPRPNVPFSRAVLWQNNTLPIQSILFRRAVLERHGGFSPDLPYLEDWDLWLRYAQAGDFLTVPKTTSLYRVPVDPALRTARMRELAGCREIIAVRRVQLGGAWAGFVPLPPDWRFKVREWLAAHPRAYKRLQKILTCFPSIKRLT